MGWRWRTNRVFRMTADAIGRWRIRLGFQLPPRVQAHSIRLNADRITVSGRVTDDGTVALFCRTKRRRRRPEMLLNRPSIMTGRGCYADQRYAEPGGAQPPRARGGGWRRRSGIIRSGGRSQRRAKAWRYVAVRDDRRFHRTRSPSPSHVLCVQSGGLHHAGPARSRPPDEYRAGRR